MSGKKVRCVDNEGRESHLVIGRIYDVDGETDTNYLLTLPWLGRCCIDKTRFQEVSSSADTIRNLPVATQVHSDDDDVVEHRLRAMLTKPRKGDCQSCGAPLPCRYHS